MFGFGRRKSENVELPAYLQALKTDTDFSSDTSKDLSPFFRRDSLDETPEMAATRKVRVSDPKVKELPGYLKELQRPSSMTEGGDSRKDLSSFIGHKK